MIRPHSPAFEHSLSETIAWCTAQPLTAESPETPETLRRRDLFSRAGKLLVDAHNKYKKAYDTPDWQRAMEMIKEAAPDSLALLEKQLRSPELEPPLQVGQPITEAERIETIAGVVTRRSALVLSRQLTNIDDGLKEKLGRLLLCFPVENVADGASQYSSNGFFDGNDIPPWDCWVQYSDHQLICWVPNVLVPLAQAGIDANAVDCITWA
jgi:hypothetical protein